MPDSLSVTSARPMLVVVQLPERNWVPGGQPTAAPPSPLSIPTHRPHSLQIVLEDDPARQRRLTRGAVAGRCVGVTRRIVRAREHGDDTEGSTSREHEDVFDKIHIGPEGSRGRHQTYDSGLDLDWTRRVIMEITLPPRILLVQYESRFPECDVNEIVGCTRTATGEEHTPWWASDSSESFAVLRPPRRPHSPDAVLKQEPACQRWLARGAIAGRCVGVTRRIIRAREHGSDTEGSTGCEYEGVFDKAHMGLKGEWLQSSSMKKVGA
jgi:hypothetical protein